MPRSSRRADEKTWRHTGPGHRVLPVPEEISGLTAEFGLRSEEKNVADAPHKGVPLRNLSRVRGNSQARFLGGKGAERPLPYPVCHSNAYLPLLQYRDSLKGA